MGRETAFDDVCAKEANVWSICLENNLGGKDIHKKCSVEQQTFDTCVATWRTNVGNAIQVKGENEGDPPFQCASMSCHIGECLRKYNYDFDRCKPHTQFFKYCVKSFYGLMSFYEGTGVSSQSGESLSLPCPKGELPSPFGCIPPSEEDTIFINTNKLVWVNSGAQLIIILVGVIDFFLGTLYFFIRRKRNEERLERSRAARQSWRVNEDGNVADPPKNRLFSCSPMPLRPLKPVSELNGRCCGCAKVADTVLLPCKHAVCCYSCSDHATYCPFCKEACTDRQRLFAV